MSDTEMNKKLNAALQQLSAENDAHWTKDGLPQVSFLSILVGGGVTRDMIEQVAPTLTRASLREAASQQGQDQQDGGKDSQQEVEQAAEHAESPQVKSDVGDFTQGATEGDTAVVVVGNPWPMHFRIASPQLPEGADANNPTDEQVVTAIQHLQSLVTRDRDALNIQLDQIGRELDHAILIRDRNFEESGGIHNANAAYMAARQVQLATKAEQMQQLRKTDLASVLKSLPKPAPIDQALKNRPRDTTQGQ